MDDKRNSTASAEQPLSSWKEIASYFSRDVRTVKRWERTRGLPVHRLPGARSGVFAFSSELASWQRGAAALDSAPETQQTATPPAAPAPLLTAALAGAAALDSEAAPLQSVPGTLQSDPSRRLPLRRALYSAGAVLAALLILGAFLLLDHRRHPVPASKPALASTANLQQSQYVPTPHAKDLYLKARYYWEKRTPGGLATALDYFTRSTQADPRYAAAYVGVADTYSLLREFAGMPDSVAFPKALAAARRAVQLDPSLAEAHRALAFSTFYWLWDRPAAEREFKLAMTLQPMDSTTHHWYANTLMEDQRLPEALAEIDRARELQPNSKAILADRCLILALNGRPAEAQRDLEQMEKEDPAFLTPHIYLTHTYLSTHSNQDLVAELKQIADLTRSSADRQLAAAAQKGFATGGEQGMYAALATAKFELLRRGIGLPVDVAGALERAGRTEDAIRALRMGYKDRDPTFLSLGAASGFPSLRKNPAFLELQRMSQRPYDERLSAAMPSLTE